MWSEKNDDWRKGLGWGKSIKVAVLMKGLFEMKKGEKIIFSNFIERFDEFKRTLAKCLE